jgi:hypothetical protein
MEKIIKKVDKEQEGDKHRTCPFLLQSEKNSICGAGMIPYVPSFFKVENYCKSLNHKNCVIYGIEAG